MTTQRCCHCGGMCTSDPKCPHCGAAAHCVQRELERCPYCGARVEDPCDEPPADTCEKALAAALLFSAPTLAEWAQKWCKGIYKAWGFTVLLEGVMVFSSSQYLALAGLAILVAINCNSAWHLAGKK